MYRLVVKVEPLKVIKRALSIITNEIRINEMVIGIRLVVSKKTFNIAF